MHTLIGKEHRHLLYKDELGEPFILLKHGEVFNGGDDTIVLYTWSKPYRDKVAQICKIIAETSTNDPLWILTLESPSLTTILSLGTHQRRPNLKGAWLREAEIKLCHKISVYEPRILRGAL